MYSVYFLTPTHKISSHHKTVSYPHLNAPTPKHTRSAQITPQHMHILPPLHTVFTNTALTLLHQHHHSVYQSRTASTMSLIECKQTSHPQRLQATNCPHCLASSLPTSIYLNNLVEGIKKSHTQQLYANKGYR